MKKVTLIVLNIIFLLPLVCLSEPVIGSAVGDYSGDVLRVILSLGLVLFIFYVGVVLFKKYMGGSVNASSALKVIGGMSLTPKDKLLIIEAGGVNLLLGISSNGITKLHAFDDNNFNSDEKSLDKSSVSFSTHLQKIINKKSS